MWPRDDRLTLQQMLDYAERALAVARVRLRDDLESDRVFRLGLTKAVEILGEAASRVSRESQAQLSAIPWREAVTTRNRPTHGSTADARRDRPAHHQPPDGGRAAKRRSRPGW
jgi:uncharacterized protein with HEPN domain